MCECPEAFFFFKMDIWSSCEFLGFIKMVGWLKFNIIEKIPFMVYLEIQCITFKMEKYFIAHPWIQRSVVGLEEYSAHDWRAATSGTARPSYLARVGPVLSPAVGYWIGWLGADEVFWVCDVIFVPSSSDIQMCLWRDIIVGQFGSTVYGKMRLLISLEALDCSIHSRGLRHWALMGYYPPCSDWETV